VSGSYSSQSGYTVIACSRALLVNDQRTDDR